MKWLIILKIIGYSKISKNDKSKKISEARTKKRTLKKIVSKVLCKEIWLNNTLSER